jgi:hypothetical protein
LYLTAMIKNLLTKFLTRGAILTVHDRRGDTSLVGPDQAIGVTFVGDDQDHLGVKPAIPAAIKEILQARAAAAQEDRQTQPRRVSHSKPSNSIMGARFTVSQKFDDGK